MFCNWEEGWFVGWGLQGDEIGGRSWWKKHYERKANLDMFVSLHDNDLSHLLLIYINKPNL
jgi:hypothetical protein